MFFNFAKVSVVSISWWGWWYFPHFLFQATMMSWMRIWFSAAHQYNGVVTSGILGAIFSRCQEGNGISDTW